MKVTSDYHQYCSGGYSPDDVVVSGMSGRFPSCENVGELIEALFNKKDLKIPNPIRFKKGDCKIPIDSCGVLKNIDKFDADFFGVDHTTANEMDPQIRLLLTVSYEAVADAGYDATTMKGARIGVYTGSINDDAMKLKAEADNVTLDSLRAMPANYVSYVFDWTGPSYCTDAACSSSMVALENALRDMQNGEVDAAIVAGVQLSMCPAICMAYVNSSVVSLTGNSRPFDVSSDGMVRSEAVAALFLQRAGTARRAYAKVCSAISFSGGRVKEGISVPSAKMQTYMNQATLNIAKIKPDEVDYVETHGTGTPVGDPIEVNSIAAIYLKNRKRPLYIGSVKSNLGHAEACSALNGLIKALVTLEMEIIPPHINLETVNPDCKALVDGTIIVATEAMPYKSSYIPINSLGVGGTMSQALLKQNPIAYKKETQKNESEVPRLCLFPATTEEGVQFVFDYIEKNPGLPNEFFALLNQLSFTKPSLKPYRGYALYQKDKAPVETIKNVVPHKKEVWFLTSGVGSEWPGMGLQLMHIPVFGDSIRRCAAIMKSYGVDLFETMRTGGDSVLGKKGTAASLVGMCAVQIAQIDLLRSLGVEPDGMLGYSMGEIACAYADGIYTDKECLLFIYLKGVAIEEVTIARGAMAAVGLSWEQAEKMCPPGVYPACDNADDSITISGTAESVMAFAEKLKNENIFVRLVNCHNFPFHTYLVKEATIQLKKIMSKSGIVPKRRSKKWLSTSYPESEWDLPECQMVGDDYFLHNVATPVLLRETLKKIPSDAIVIEIGPHFLLQSILKRQMSPQNSIFGLMMRNNPDNVKYLFDSLGKMYNEGVNLEIEKLYPPVQFPVPRGTPRISDLLKWDQSMSFHVPQFKASTTEFTRTFEMNKKDAYILDHQIDGKGLFPATGYMYLAWSAFASKNQKEVDETPVIIENFKIHRAVLINAQTPCLFSVNILNKTGHFEVTEGKSIVASGEVREFKDEKFAEPDPVYTCNEFASLSGQEVYGELYMSGYEYGPVFQGLKYINIEGTSGQVLWKEHWIAFLDSLLLFFGLITMRKDFRLPTGCQSIKIDPTIMKKMIAQKKRSEAEECSDFPSMPVTYNADTRVCRSVGVELCNLETETAHRRGHTEIAMHEIYKFIPYSSTYRPSHEAKANIMKYFKCCNEAMNKIHTTSGNDYKKYQFTVEGTVENNIDEDPDEELHNRCILEALNQVSDDSSTDLKKRKEIFTSYVHDIGRDTLNHSLMNEETLRIIIEFLTENTYRKLSVAEISRNFPCILKPLTIMLQKFFHTKFKKSSLVEESPLFPITDMEYLQEHHIHLVDKESLIDEKDLDISISSFTHGTIDELQDLVKDLKSMTKPTGFILLFFKGSVNSAEKFLSMACSGNIQVQSQKILEDILPKLGLAVLMRIADPFGGFVYILRQPASEKVQRVVRVTNDNYLWVNELKKELKDNSGTIWLLADDSEFNGVIGLVNCLKQEPGGERIRCVFISEKKPERTLPPFSFKHTFYKPILEKNMIMNVWRDGVWGSFRHIAFKPKPTHLVDHSVVTTHTYGDLSALEWVESRVKHADPKNKNLINIYYSALNFKDIMLASGKISVGTAEPKNGTTSAEVKDSILGLEFAGRETSGRRVCGLTGECAIATSILSHPTFYLEVPDSWTLEEAATVPVVYATCYYALIMRANLQKGESILIHSGTGGIGIAAIRIASSMGCQIFVTLGSNEKRKYIKKNFPHIKDENIGSSRDTTFMNMVMNGTKGRGVDVVLNSLADEKFIAGYHCVANNGRFVEIGKYDLALDRQIGVRKLFHKNVSFIAVFLDKLFRYDPKTLKTVGEIFHLIREGIRTGVVQPLDRVVFQRDQIEEAFRYMAKGVHIGKILIKIRDEESAKTVIPRQLKTLAVPNTYFYSNKSYVIIGGLGGFGIEVAKWMITRGARNIILTSRYGARTPYHHLCLNRWKNEGINVLVSTRNVNKYEEAKKLLEDAIRIGPVGGIINSAVVLQDAFFDVQTPELYKEVCAPKADATLHLDSLSREMCPSLDLFVCFSSISCGRGNAGQTNYGFANSVMERICEERQRIGLHGLAIQWGIIGEVGLFHRQMGDDALLAGVKVQSLKSCLEAFDAFCQQDCPVVTTYMPVTHCTKKASAEKDVMSHLAKILGVDDTSQLSTTRTFGEMGIDSMVGVELKQLFESCTDVAVTIQEIREMKINDLTSAMQENDQPIAQAPTFFSSLVAKLPSTLKHKDPIIELNLEQDSKIDPVFIVSLGDEDITHFIFLAKALKRNVYALVWTKDSPTSDVPSIASYYLKLIQNVTKGPFHLIGHSLGGTVAMEMGIQCKKTKDNLKTIHILSGTRDLLNNINIDDDTESANAEVSALIRFVEQFVESSLSGLEDELLRKSNLEERKRIVLDRLTSSTHQSGNKSEVMEAVTNFMQKFKVIQPYVPVEKLQMDIDVIEDPSHVLANDVSALKEALSQVCLGKITIQRLFCFSRLTTKEEGERLATLLPGIV